MAKKNKKNNIKIIWVVVIAVAVLFFLLLVIFGNLKKATAPVNPSIMPSVTVFKTYHSDLLDITIDVPNDFILKEENALREMVFEKDAKTVIVHRYSTNRYYNNIKELLDEIYDSYDSSKEISRQQIKINNKDCELSVKRYYNNSKLNQKSYDCYLDGNSFLSFSTTSPELYADLDKIASSFRYEAQPAH